MPLLLPFLIALALSLALVPVVIRVARARGLVAHPTSDRWHRQPIPNVGGVAIFVPFMLALVVSGVVQELAPVAAGCTLMYLIGLGDDLHPVRPATKLVLEGAILRAEADLRWLDLVEEHINEGSSG